MKLGGKISVVCLALTLAIGTALSGCSKKEEPKKEESKVEKKELNLFIAASLTDAIDELVKDFEKENPDVKVNVNADSSGKLESQIEEGFDCDIFLSASTKEMDALKDKDMLVKDSVMDLLQNQLAIIAAKDYDGPVKDLATVNQAKSIALPYGSVPAGFYTRKALIAEGILKTDATDKETIKNIPGKDVGDALGGVTVSEKENVSTSLSAVAEKSTEVGFTYVSDAKRNENVKIVNEISVDKTGRITYPIGKIKPKKDDKDREALVEKLYKDLTGDKAKKVYEKYGFKAN